MPVYRLGSNGLVHAPGLIACAINGYAFQRDRAVLRHVVVAGWPGVPEDAVHQLLSGSVPHAIEGDTVVFAADSEPIDALSRRIST